MHYGNKIFLWFLVSKVISLKQNKKWIAENWLFMQYTVCVYIYIYVYMCVCVTLDHKTSHKGQFFEIEIYT